MKTNYFILFFLIFTLCGYSQVGINTTTPNAQLDIRSSNQANPDNTDGILIPKIDTFPAVNPTIDQQGMLVYLTTTSGSNPPGFYYWNNPSTSWIPIKGTDTGTLDQAYDFGGPGAGNTIIADAGAVTVDGTDGLVSTGVLGSGVLMPNGAGVRMVWNPRRGAFRVGRVLGAQWDDTNIGSFSVAFGQNTTASGPLSTAFGQSTTASGQNTTAFGFATTASGDRSTALGNLTTAFGFATTAFGTVTSATGPVATAFGNSSIASGSVSTAFGQQTNASAFASTAFGYRSTASGSVSTAIGMQNTASSYGETVIGIGATAYTPSDDGALQFRAANAMDRLFVIGNAIDANNNSTVDAAERSDAMIVLKNGLTRLPSMDNAMIDAADGKTVVTKEYLQDRSSGTLDQAYDFGSPGAGNTIIADAGALMIAGTDGFVSTGTFNSGAMAPSGTGTGVRMVWNPRKGAFRAGGIFGTHWDDENIGNYSAAFGFSTIASNVYSTAFGNSTTASGAGSTAFGSSTTASGNHSIAFGQQTIASGGVSAAFGLVSVASGIASAAFGQSTTASGVTSTAFGRQNTAISYAETVIGLGATTYTPSANGATQFRTANATDRLFVIGNAIDANNNSTVDDSERSNALTILKNGNVALGNITPTTTLDIDGQIRIRGGNPAEGRLLISDANGTASWQNLNVSGWSTIGNTGLSAATNFIGTTNAIDVIFRRNNVRAGRLGVNNTSFGVNALNPAGTGTFNTAIGSASLESITNGSRNAAVGSVSLNANTTGDNNTALGVDALSFNETGNNNTAVGRRAMGNTGALTSGSNNTALGYFAYSTGNFTNSTALGANTVITASNQIRVGNNTVTSIGGTVGFTNLSDSRFKKNIQSDVPGLTFIKKLKPVTYQLDMESMARFLNTPEESRDRNAERIRENTLETGFIAQEVEQAAREAGFVFSGVDVPKGNGDYYGLRYASFVVPLVKAMQEQQEIIDQQNKKIVEQNEKIELQKNEIDTLKQQFQEQYNLLLQRIEQIENH